MGATGAVAAIMTAAPAAGGTVHNAPCGRLRSESAASAMSGERSVRLQLWRHCHEARSARGRYDAGALRRSGIACFAAYGPYGLPGDLNDFSTVSRLVRLSDTPVWPIFSVAPAAAVVSTL